MSENCNNSKQLLARNGTAQNQRYIDALDPTRIKLMDLSTADWMRFALQFSKKINYFNTLTNATEGNWEGFFPKENEIEAFVAKLEALETQQHDDEQLPSDTKVHLTLFAAFLKLTSYSQERLNKISKKHLDFYYGEVLKLTKKAPVADTAHILFELAKNASPARIAKDTALDGGKDGIGKKRIYKTAAEIIVNNSVVSSLRNIYPHDGVGLKNSFVANSLDGLGTDFIDDTKSWWPFGHPRNEQDTTNPLPELPMAKTGFGIAAPILQLKEGNRTIMFEFTLDKNITASISGQDIINSVNIYLSGEKEWILATIDDTLSEVNGTKLKLVANLDAGADAVIGYNEEVLLEPYQTTDPVARFVLDYTKENSRAFLGQQFFSKTVLENVTITVEVSDLQDFVVENDLGVLDASKPFYPFGTIPVEGSNMFLGLPEALDKNWEWVQMDITWKDRPADFSKQYTAYRKEFLQNISKEAYTLTLENGAVNDQGLSPIVTNDSYFKADVHVLQDGIWKEIKEYKLFVEDLEVSDPVLEADNAVTWKIDVTKQTSKNTTKQDIQQAKHGTKDAKYKYGPPMQPHQSNTQKNPSKPFTSSASSDKKFSAAIKEGFIRVTLNQSFLHRLYTKLYTIALSKIYSSNILIPNEPYTPQIETIKVGYKATAAYTDVNFFHEHPFGVSEESLTLKNNSVLPTAQRKITLLPSYDKSSLLIGLHNAENLQQINLLIQTLEGSENPETTNDFAENEKLQWYILCNNEWLSMNRDYIFENNTDNFLKRGIVKLSIPKEATTNNTKLPEGSFWLKVENPRDFDTTSQLLNIHAQAISAQFEDNQNALDHLKYGLEAGAISKFVERIATIKKVEQPYSSFGGKPEETDDQYYRRISERLRHKQRAITIWDYEHLILQEFTDIYKVNCLNHTSMNSALSPGNVTLVVIPNIIQKNVYNSYKPRISKAQRNEIKAFINKLNTLHVTAEVINPIYKEVRVILKAKFYDGYDANFYTTQLQKDIAKLLSPWAFEETAILDFGLTLHESRVIHYIEQLDYVDYITDFELQQESGKNEQGETLYSKARKVVPTSAKVILTSVEYTKHDVTAITPADTCTKKKNETANV